MTPDVTDTSSPVTIRYGPHPDQFARLYLPVGTAPVPVAAVVHGGFWRRRYGIELAEPLAEDLVRRGIAALAIEYRRVGVGMTVGGGDTDVGTRGSDSGGWPGTLADVAAAVDALAALGQQHAGGRLDLERVAAVGHSAGGHLVAWLAHRGSLPPGSPGSYLPGDGCVPIVGAVAQAGALDLVGADAERLGDGAVANLIGGPFAELPERYEHASPLARVGHGAHVVCVHGDADDVVPVSQSRRYVEAARAAGDPAELTVLPGLGHFELIDPAHEAWTVCRDAVERMLASRRSSG